MNTPNRLEKFQRRNKGIALVIVISVIAVLTVLTVAMLSLADTERRTAAKFSEGETAAMFADTAVNIVMSQIWDGTNQQLAPRTIWASQPGAVRKYDGTGRFIAGYKLYSSDQMIVQGSENQMVTDTPDIQWQSKSGVWVDLNEPVIRPNPQSPNNPSASTIVFPILDPRAFVSSDLNPNGQISPRLPDVEGFTYMPVTAMGVVSAQNAADPNARLPMPVKWIYVLQDGSLGSASAAGSGTSVNWVGSVSPTVSNPIVARIAFWTDDESCKININTAGEPTPWYTPTVNYDLDMQWAASPPTRFEYQRYPGHPATVALSSVLVPNVDLDSYGLYLTDNKQVSLPSQPAPTGTISIQSIKERIYSIMPKMNSGGSIEGSIPFWYFTDVNQSLNSNSGSTVGNIIDIASGLRKPLFASVDDMIFSQQLSSGGFRLGQDNVTMPSTPNIGLFPYSQQVSTYYNTMLFMARLGGFLTAHSHSPELNMFGMPRVAMWPIADDYISNVIGRGGQSSQYRTAFDNMIAYASSNGPSLSGQYAYNTYTYFFRRANPNSVTYDVSSIPRNQLLLNYLFQLTAGNFTMPSGGASSRNYANKYGPQGTAQILAEIFDYIRCTNLYDGVLAPTRDTVITDPNLAINNGGAIKRTDAQTFAERDQIIKNPTYGLAYTAPRAAIIPTYSSKAISGTAFPGQGQVLPIHATIGGAQVRGLGRFPTITEVTFHFIATADGSPDPNSWRPYYSSKNAQGQQIWMHVPNTANPLSPTYNSPTGVQTVGAWSGGRSALKINTAKSIPRSAASQTAPIQGDPHKDQDNQETVYSVYYSNFPYVNAADKSGVTNLFNTYFGTASPSSTSMNQPLYHPGFTPANWNSTLQVNTPLTSTQRRIQGMLGLEFTVVNSGWVGIYSDFCVTVSGLSQISIVQGTATQRLFPQGIDTLIWHANRSLFDGYDCRAAVGSAGPFNMVDGRGARPYMLQLGSGDTSGKQVWVKDQAYGGQNTGGPSSYPSINDTGYNWGTSFDLVTDFLTVNSNAPMAFSTTGGNGLVFKIYGGHMPSQDTLVQTVTVPLPQNLYLPVPQLVVLSAPWVQWTDSRGNVNNVYATEAPHWWGFNYSGVLGRFSGSQYQLSGTTVTGSATPVLGNGSVLGRFYSNETGSGTLGEVPGYGGLIWAYDGGGAQLITPGVAQPGASTTITNPYPTQNDFASTGTWSGAPGPGGNGQVSGKGYLFGPGATRPFGQDVFFSLVPVIGDARVLAARDVGPNDWELHAGFRKVDISAGGVVNPQWCSIPNQPSYAAGGATARQMWTAGGTGECSFVHHELERYNVSGYDPGFSTGEPSKSGSAPQNIGYRLVYAATYNQSITTSAGTTTANTIPDVPGFNSTSASPIHNSAPTTPYDAQHYGDFDNGIGGLRDGPWINKPDEGSTSVNYVPKPNAPGQTIYAITAYFDANWLDAEAGEQYMTPNRQISSPGMLGSLPTGVFGNNLPKGSLTGAGTLGVPWRTLLFHAYSNNPNNLNSEQFHPGSPQYLGGVDPADHYFMDLFWMPVVEPYAISEPLATAGKINMNYQMVPFNTYIRRATGMHAVFKGEYIGAYPTADASFYKENPPDATATWVLYPLPSAGITYAYSKFSAYGASGSTRTVAVPSGPVKLWYRRIEAGPTPGVKGSALNYAQATQGTLSQFDARFEFDASTVGSQYVPGQAMGLFRTASQICEVFLLPKKIPGNTPPPNLVASAPLTITEALTDGSDANVTTPYRPADMSNFYAVRGVTGDNVKERPYANIYQKITTQSNTYRVHYRVQTIRKARSTAPGVFDSTKDSVTSDYRGSSLIERRINPNVVNVDYAQNPNATPMSQFYSFRVLESKRFQP